MELLERQSARASLRGALVEESLPGGRRLQLNRVVLAALLAAEPPDSGSPSGRRRRLAERLVPSVSTVDHHVSAILNTLGVSARREAAARHAP